MKSVADMLGVSRSNLIERLKGRSKPRRSYHKAEDAELLPIGGSPRSSIARGEPPISLSSTPNGFIAS